MASQYAVMREDERQQASTQGFGDFFKGVRGAFRKRRLYAAVDEGRKGLTKLKVDDADGEAIAVLCGAYARTLGVITFFRDKKVGDIASAAAARQFVGVFGRYVAEGYLKAQKVPASRGPSLLALAVSGDEIRSLIQNMQQAGSVALDAEDRIEPPDDATVDEAVELLTDVLGRYESAIPAVDEDGSVPARIQDEGIAKAAFLGLRAKDLRNVSTGSKDELESASRELLASRLAEEYAGREQEIAEILLGRAQADSATGLITRLMPLDGPPPDLHDVAERLTLLKGRFYETGAAEWFCFRDVQRTPRTLTITGDILGYQVSVTEVKDQARLQPTRQREKVTIRLRDGVPWAETNARRAGNLTSIRRVLRRTELAVPHTTLVVPEAVTDEPFSRCDGRSLWILEWLYRELSSDPFRVDDHLMVNFERPTSMLAVGETPSERKPLVTAVRLKGLLLIDHPEVCDLILRARRIVDIELLLRVHRRGVDPHFAPRMKIRFGWANDHLVLSSSGIDGDYDVSMHNKLVGDIRRAATRTIDSGYIALPMQRIVANASRAETDELGSVLAIDEDGDQSESGQAA